MKKEDADKVEYKSHFDRSNFFEPSKCGNARLFVMDTLPKKLVCCKKTRKQKGIQKAIEAMNFEIDIIEMIKKGRYVNMALKLLLTSEQRMNLKQKSRYICIDPDEVSVKSDAMEEM